MTEWWTYRPSDLLMFSPRTYHRLFELHNAEVWPAQLLTVGLGAAVALAWWRRRGAVFALAFAVFGFIWGWVAFGYFGRQLASIHTAAAWCAGAFAVQGALLLLAEATVSARHTDIVPGRRTRAVGLGLMAFALIVQPLLALLSGRPWAQAQVFGIAPDPTVIATLGLLTVSSGLPPRWLDLALWAVPLAWCVLGAMTLATMDSWEAVLMPAAAALALWGRRAAR